MAPEQELLLSDLCRICNINPPKYRCPRCSLRTCSLPCSVRHKSWAQCSGERDPAAYARRSDLATPAGIDRDFNYLTSLERHLARADALAAELGYDDPPPAKGKWKGKGKGTGPRKGEVGFNDAVRRTGVRIAKAPKGLTRARENKSKWIPRRKCLLWTVEWRDAQGGRDVVEVFDDVVIEAAYRELVNSKQPKRVKKRKRGPKEELEAKAETKEDEEQGNVDEAPAVDTSADNEATEEPAQEPDDNHTRPRHERASSDDTLVGDPAPTSLPPASPPPSQESQPPSTPLHFYLHRPHTPTPLTVLIPLSGTSTLTAALHARTILEFPTIYVLPHSPDDLPEGFITEEAWEVVREQQEREADEVLAGLGLVVGAEDREEGEVVEGDEDEAMDEQRMLAVLKRDLGNQI